MVHCGRILSPKRQANCASRGAGATSGAYRVRVWLSDPRDEREEDLATLLAYRGMVNMIDNFLPRRQYRGAGGWTWSMQRDSRQVKGRGITYSPRIGAVSSTQGYRRHVMLQTIG